jgi:hypothetical protein
MSPIGKHLRCAGGLRFQRLASCAFPLLAAAASVTLSAGGAMAAGPLFCPGSPPDTATTTTIPGVVTATCLPIPGDPSPSPDTVPNWNATNNLGSQAIAGGRQDDVVIDFNDGMSGTDMPGIAGGFTGYFYYTITSIDDPYISTTLDLNANMTDVIASKKIWYSNPGPNPLAPTIPANLDLSWTGSTVMAPITPATQTVWVLDTYTLTSTAPALDNVKNRFSTPGPLPVLSAGAAFGFSRRLRARVKASRSA